MLSAAPAAPSVRQCGPGLARGLARASRRVLTAQTSEVLSRIYGPLLRRWCVRLRRRTALDLLRSMRNALRAIEVAECRSTPTCFDVAVTEVCGGTMLLMRATAELRAWPDGGCYIDARERLVAVVSRHAQERLHLRLSTTDWSICARELASLLPVERIADTAHEAGTHALWFRAAHGGFCVAFDEEVPRVVTFLDELKPRHLAEISGVERCLAADDATSELAALQSRRTRRQESARCLA